MRSLQFLNYLRIRAAIRMRVVQLLSVKGLIFVFTILLFLYFIRSSILGMTAGESGIDADAVDSEWIALGMFAACLLTLFTSTGSAIHFSAAEMNILFSAPISRAALVANKFLSYIVGAILSSLLLVLVIPPIGLNRSAMFAAMILTLLFVQLLSATLGMVGTLASRKFLFIPSRKSFLTLWLPLMLGTLCLYLYLAGYFSHDIHESAERNLAEFAQKVRRSSTMQIVLAPFSLFAGLYQFDVLDTVYIAQLTAAVMVLATLLTLIVYLDSFLQEESSAASINSQTRWSAMLKTGSVWQKTVASGHSTSGPFRLGGFMAIAWTQCLRLFRAAPSLAYGMPSLALMSGIAVGAANLEITSTKFISAAFFIFVFLLPKMLTYDYRGSPESIVKLKTLPLSPWLICVGQLLTPVIFSSGLLCLFVMGATFFGNLTVFKVLPLCILITMSFNILLYSTENASFLLAPAKLVPVGRIDFDFLGRTLVEFLLKCLVLGIATSIVGSAGWVVRAATPGSWYPALATMALVLVLLSLLAIYVVTITYRRFDVSTLK